MFIDESESDHDSEDFVDATVPHEIAQEIEIGHEQPDHDSFETPHRTGVYGRESTQSFMTPFTPTSTTQANSDTNEKVTYVYQFM